MLQKISPQKLEDDPQQNANRTERQEEQLISAPQSVPGIAGPLLNGVLVDVIGGNVQSLPQRHNRRSDLLRQIRVLIASEISDDGRHGCCLFDCCLFDCF